MRGFMVKPLLCSPQRGHRKTLQNDKNTEPQQHTRQSKCCCLHQKGLNRTLNSQPASRLACVVHLCAGLADLQPNTVIGLKDDLAFKVGHHAALGHFVAGPLPQQLSHAQGFNLPKLGVGTDQSANEPPVDVGFRVQDDPLRRLPRIGNHGGQ